MPFKKGERLPNQGGKREGAGRPSKEQREIKKAAAEIAKEFIETHVQGFLDSYLDLGTGKVIEQKNKAGKTVKVKFIPADPATVRHAIDKILPDEQMESAQQPRPITFINFADIRPSRLPPKDITPLASNGKVASPSLPMPTTREQTKLEPPQVKFHGFAYASENGKRRK
jgi:hypothetical protein